ncbi:hypothetical protein X975_14697, partial [Stegodyphus mimosarum]
MSQKCSIERPFSGPTKRLFSETMDQIVCEKCQTTFTQRKSLYSHMRKVHCEEPDLKCNQLCGMCDRKFRTTSQLHDHLQLQHDILLKFLQLTFYSEEEFLEWKRKIEKDDQSSFLLKSSLKNKETGVKLTYYTCHRSGIYIPKEDRMRHLKAKGSIKSGCTCPAIINVSAQTVNEATEIKVVYQSKHVGHELEVGKLPLSKEEKSNLASSLHLGIPMSKILDKTRKKYSPTKRYGLTTRKDLHNIQKEFKIEKNIMLHEDDATSVDITVKKLQDGECNSVLVYKQVGKVLEDFPAIQKEEFLLGIMNEPQQKLLELYGSDCIMIDSTHGTNQYGFQLSTVTVHDENHEGLPIAVLFSTRTAADTFIPFFNAIKKRIPNMKTKVFMSDDTNSYYNAWQAVFEDSSRHLLCTWHINKNWNFQINSKVKNKTNKENIKIELKKIITEVDVITFERLMSNFISTFEDKEKNFIEYFKTNYEKRTEKWAYCHRVGLGINTNMKIERWHRQLKYEEAGGTIIKRLDRSIAIITNAIAKKLLSRMISLERGKLTSRIMLIRKRHKNSLEMKNEYYFFDIGNKYTVTKTVQSTVYTYEVEKVNDSCSCPIRCDECNICIHSMSCKCIDFSIRFVICKHIHYVCTKLKQASIENPHEQINTIATLHEQFSGDNLIIDEERNETERNIIVPYLQKNQSLENKKTGLLNKLQDLQRRLSECESEHVLHYAEQNINAINAYMDISLACSLALPEKLPEQAKAPSNKYIKKQRNLFTKKSANQPSKADLTCQIFRG